MERDEVRCFGLDCSSIGPRSEGDKPKAPSPSLPEQPPTASLRLPPTPCVSFCVERSWKSCSDSPNPGNLSAAYHAGTNASHEAKYWLWDQKWDCQTSQSQGATSVSGEIDAPSRSHLAKAVSPAADRDIMREPPQCPVTVGVCQKRFRYRQSGYTVATSQPCGNFQAMAGLAKVVCKRSLADTVGPGSPGASVKTAGMAPHETAGGGIGGAPSGP